MAKKLYYDSGLETVCGDNAPLIHPKGKYKFMILDC